MRESLAGPIALAQPALSWRARTFFREMKPGDRVATHDSEAKRFLLGRISSEAREDAAVPEPHRLRNVTWEQHVASHELTTDARNKLGSISTLFTVSNEASPELLNEARPLTEALPEQTSWTTSPLEASPMAAMAFEAISNYLDANWPTLPDHAPREEVE